MFNSSSVKDNNTIKFAPGDELEVSKQDITPLDLIDDLNKFSKNGFSAAIGIPKFVFSYRSIFYLL